MASPAAESAVRDYLRALKDPDGLKDEGTINDLQKRVESAADGLERLRLRQELLDLQNPSMERWEEAFVMHAKAWADEHHVTGQAFIEDGVETPVLRKAGLLGGQGPRGRGRGAGRNIGGGTRAPRTRVTVEQVRQAIPAGAFTIKQLQDASGASPAVVRKVVQEEAAAGRLKTDGSDPDHRGPGRAPVLYKRA